MREIQALSCVNAWRMLRADRDIRFVCATAFEGTLTTGEDCYSHSECARSHRCRGIDTGRCPGTCTPIVSACADDIAPTPACTAPEICASDGSCVLPGDIGAACTSSGDCVDPLYCIDGECGRGADVGEPCDGRTMPCIHGLDCAEIANGSICERPAFGLAVGESCRRPIRNCGNGLACDRERSQETGTCVQRPRLGDACSDDGIPCEQGSVCLRGPDGDPQRETCQWPRALGELCGRSADCVDGICLGGVCSEEPPGTVCRR